MVGSRTLHAFLTAVQFLTRLPVPGGMNRPGADRTLLRAAVVFYPLVGGLVGAFTGGVVWAAAHVWPVAVAVALGLTAEALLTGAFHEDAVADCCDAFGGGWSRDDVLRILKDSRVGSFGALGLTLAVLLRGGSLAAVEPGLLVAAGAASGAVGRWVVLVLMAAVPTVSDRVGLASDVSRRVGWWAVAAGGVLMIPGSAWLAAVEPLRFAVGVVAAVACVLAWGWYVRWRIGGVTGDCLGAGCYLGQVVVLLAVAARGGA